jgi:hypothetical protein
MSAKVSRNIRVAEAQKARRSRCQRATAPVAPIRVKSAMAARLPISPQSRANCQLKYWK